MNGILNIYKEKDFTSHDVVAKLRGICRQKKIGHTGTLDPMAEGVLPICLGNATKLCDLLTDHSKSYEAEFILGQKSDTYDITGVIEKITETVPEFSEIEGVIKSFIPGYYQVPPMYSAKKVNGKKLYELARSGIEIEREPVFVSIENITIKSMDDNKITIVVDCGKGTYIRSLINDIGNKLGCGAVMSSLTRIRVGAFRSDTAIRLSEAEEYMHQGILESYILNTDKVFEDCRLFEFNEKQDMCLIDKMLHNGNFFSRALSDIVPKDGERFRVYDSQSSFVGVYEYHKDKELYKPYKMFL